MKNNLAKLKNKFAGERYDEIYVNIGREFLPMVRGLRNIIPKTAKITCAEGAGFGFKLAHMKDWFEKNTSGTWIIFSHFFAKFRGCLCVC